MALPLAPILGGVNVISKLFGGGEPTESKESKALIAAAPSRPNEIPTLAGNHVIRGGDNFSIDERGNPISKSRSSAAVKLAAEAGGVVRTTKTVTVNASKFGARAGDKVPVYEFRAIADERAAREAAARQTKNSNIFGPDPAAISIFSELANEKATVDRVLQALPVLKSQPINTLPLELPGLTVFGDAPPQPMRDNTTLLVVIGGVVLLVATVAVVIATRN